MKLFTLIVIDILVGVFAYFAGFIFYQLFISSSYQEPPPWFNFIRAVFVGAVMALTGVFFFTLFHTTDTFTILSNAIKEALPIIIGIVVAVVAIVFLGWRINKSNHLLDKVEKEAEGVKYNAWEAARAYEKDAFQIAKRTQDDANANAKKVIFDAEIKAAEIIQQALKKKEETDLFLQELAEESENRDNKFDEKCQRRGKELEEEYERKKGSWLEEINGLRKKCDTLTYELRRARKAGIVKMRAQGNEGAARRMEQELINLIGTDGEEPQA